MNFFAYNMFLLFQEKKKRVDYYKEYAVDTDFDTKKQALDLLKGDFRKVNIFQLLLFFALLKMKNFKQI